MRLNRKTLALAGLAVVVAATAWLALHPRRPHNVILFVADGLRSGVVTPQTAPELAALRNEGVDFQNSRVIAESLGAGGLAPPAQAKTRRSAPAPNGFVTQLNYQAVGDTPYFDAAGMPGRVLGVH